MIRNPQLWQLLIRDVRFQRGLLLLYWCVAILLPLRVFWKGPDGVINQIWSCVFVGFYFVLSLILIRAIRLDPPEKTVHYLGSHIVIWQDVLLAKGLFVGLFLLVPLWIAKLGTIYGVGIPFRFQDALLCAFETGIEAGSVLAVVALFALFLRRILFVYLSLFALILLLIVVANIYDSIDLADPDRHMDDLTLTNCRWLIFGLAWIVTVIITAFVRYRTKAILTPMVLSLTGFGLSLLMGLCWPWNPSLLFSDHVVTGEVAPTLRDKLRLTLTGRNDANSYSLSGFGSNGSEFYDLDHDVTIEGLEPPYFAKLIDCHAQATLRSGRVIESSYCNVSAHYGEGGLTDEMRQQLAGFKTDMLSNWNKYDLEFFNYMSAPVVGQDLNGASLKGVMTLEIRRVVILKTVPLKSNQIVLMPRRRTALQQVQFTPTGVQLGLLKESAFLTLRGDCPAWNDHEYLSWLVFNRNKGESLSPADEEAKEGGHRKDYPVAFYDVTFSQFRYGLGEDHQPIPSDWAAGAEICFFSTKSCGQISLPFEIPSIDLTPKY